MGGRFLISGVQLGMFKALAKVGDNEGVCKLSDDIERKQFVSDSDDGVEQDAKAFNDILIFARQLQKE